MTQAGVLRQLTPSLLAPTPEELVEQIVLCNHIWKRLRERRGSDDELVQAMRLRKGELQVRLLRAHRDRARAVPASDQLSHDEEMFTVTLEPPVRLPDGSWRTDAEHLPWRVVRDLMSAAEIEDLLGARA